MGLAIMGKQIDSESDRLNDLNTQHCGKIKEYIERMFDKKTYMDARRRKVHWVDWLNC